MEKKITMNHNDKKIEYILYDTPPCRPFLNINGFYLRLSNIPSGDIRINGLYPYMQRNSIYITNEDGLLRKIATKNGMEEWNYNVGKNINSVFSQNTNVFIANKENITEINDNKQLLKTLNIQSDKTISDGENFYTAKGTKLSKVTANGQEQFSYNLDANIKDIATDKVGNIYVATAKDIRKLAKKIIGDKESRNLIRNSGNCKDTSYWSRMCGAGSECGTLFTNADSIPLSEGVGLQCKKAGGYCILYNDTLEKEGFKFDTTKQYTLSGNIWCSNDMTVDIQIASGNSLNQVTYHRCNIQKGYNDFNFTFTPSIQGKENDIRFCILNAGSIFVKYVQLEEGDKATSWTPNSQDYINIGEWKYSINSNSIALDSENNIYISNNSNIEKLNTQGQKIDTLDIQADKIALDLEDNLYVSKDKSAEKLAKKMIGDKDSRNLLPESKTFSGEYYNQDIQLIPNAYKDFTACVTNSNWSFESLKTKECEKIFTEEGWYTCSCYAKADKEDGAHILITFADHVQGECGSVTTEWKRYSTSVYFKPPYKPYAEYKGFRFEFGGVKKDNKVYVCGECVVKGKNMSSDWTPNILDYIRQGEWKYIDSSKINNICVG